MDLDSLVPSGGGSLRGPARPLVREPVATFTRPVVQHPDEIWSPRGSELGPPRRPLTQSAQFYSHAESERPAERQHGPTLPHVEAAAQVRLQSGREIYAVAALPAGTVPNVGRLKNVAPGVRLIAAIGVTNVAPIVVAAPLALTSEP
jgi:hypothetical protein